MKTLSPGLTAALAGPVVEPCFLIEITLDETMRLSTRQRYERAGVVYEPGLVQGLQISQSQVSFGLVNTDFRHTTPALTGIYQRAPVSVWWTEGSSMLFPLIEGGYVDDGYYDLEGRPAPVLVFRGHVTEFSQITTVLGVVAARSAARRYPTLRVLPPIANFVRPEGTVLQFGTTTFRLESRDNN